MSWAYYRDNYVSARAALEAGYSNLVNANEEVRHLVYTIQMAEARLNEIMKEVDGDG